jgi:hypothetical protein
MSYLRQFDYNFGEGFCPVEHYQNQISGQAVSGAVVSVWDCGWGWRPPHSFWSGIRWQKPSLFKDFASHGFPLNSPEQAKDVLGDYYEQHRSSIAYCVEMGIDVSKEYAAFFGVDVDEIKRQAALREAEEEEMFG